MSNDEIRHHLRTYQRAVTGDPTNVVLRRKLAQYLVALGYRDEAVRELELCSKLLAAQGDPIAAIACAKELLSLEPGHTEILLFLSRHYADNLVQQRKDRVATPLSSDSAEVVVVPAEPSAAPKRAPEDIDLTVLTLESDEVELDDDPGLDDLAGLEEEHRSFMAALVGAPPERSPLPTVRRELPHAAPLKLDPGTLARIPLFSTLPADAFVALIEHLQVRRVPEGCTLTTSTTVSTAETAYREPALQIVVSGAVSAELQGPPPVALGIVDVGSFFGEFELLTGRPHDVCWTAIADTVLLVLPKGVLEDLLTRFPSIGRELWALYRNRLVLDFLAGSPLFKSLDATEREELAEKFDLVTAAPGDVVARAGEPSRGFFLVRDGQMEAFVAASEPIAVLRAGDVFGVHAVASGEPFRASVRAVEPTTLLVLPAHAVAQLLLLYPSMRSAFERLGEERARLAAPMVVGSTNYGRQGFSPG